MLSFDSLSVSESLHICPASLVLSSEGKVILTTTLAASPKNKCKRCLSACTVGKVTFQMKAVSQILTEVQFDKRVLYSNGDF